MNSRRVGPVGAVAMGVALLVAASFFALQSGVQAQSDEESGICGRTSQVQAVILSKLDDVSDCANVTDDHLAGITGKLNLSSGDYPGNPSVISSPDLVAQGWRLRRAQQCHGIVVEGEQHHPHRSQHANRSCQS